MVSWWRGHIPSYFKKRNLTRGEWSYIIQKAPHILPVFAKKMNISQEEAEWLGKLIERKALKGLSVIEPKPKDLQKQIESLVVLANRSLLPHSVVEELLNKGKKKAWKGVPAGHIYWPLIKWHGLQAVEGKEIYEKTMEVQPNSSRSDAEKIVKELLRNPAFSDKQIFDFIESSHERGRWLGFGMVISGYYSADPSARLELLNMLAKSASPARVEAYKRMSPGAFAEVVNSIPENDSEELATAIKHRLMESKPLGCGPLTPDTIARCFTHFMGDTAMVIALIEAVSPIPEEAKQILLQHPDRNIRMRALNSIGQEVEMRGASKEQRTKEQAPNQARSYGRQNPTRKL